MSRRRGAAAPDPDAVRAVAELSRRIPMPHPDDAEHAALTTPDEAPRGRVIRSAEDARGRDLELIMRRLDKLETTMNAASWEINQHNKFLVEFREAFGKMLFYPFYRFVVWIFPIPLPMYKKGKTVPHITRHDQTPYRQGGYDG